MKKGTTFLRKVLSTVLAAAIGVCALFVPAMITASAEAVTTVYDFEADSGSVKTIGDKNYLGASFALETRDGKGVLMGWNPDWQRTWNTPDAMRFNKNNGETYALKGGHTYIVELEIKVPTAIKEYAGSTAAATYTLGYGVEDRASGSERLKLNYPLFTVASYGVNSVEYTADTITGKAVYPIGADTAFRKQTYVFTAPASAEGLELGMYGNNWYGGNFWVDTVTVTDLSDEGAIVAVNTATGEETVYHGNKGETLELPTLEAFEGHAFSGWYDAAGSEKMASVKYAGETTFVYAMFNGIGGFEPTPENATVYDFEDKSGSVKTIGDKNYLGASFSLEKREGKGVLMGWNPDWKRAWNTPDAMRFNKNNGETYTLKAGHLYGVTFDVKVPTAINEYCGTTATATYTLGYGVEDLTSGSERLKLRYPLFTVAAYGVNSTSYTADTMSCVRSYPIGKTLDYHKQTYFFRAPEDAEGLELGMYGNNWYGGNFWVDKVTVCDYDTTGSVVVAVNTLTDEETYYTGTVGEAVSLSPLTDAGGRAFRGWFDENGENEKTSIKYSDGVTVVYGFFEGDTEYTFVTPDGEVKASGSPEDAIAFPEVPEFSGEKKFIGWYSDSEFAEAFTATEYGLKNRKIYAGYSAKVNIVCHDTYNGEDLTVSGYPGDEIEFPDPRDKKHSVTDDGCSLFVDWYTSADLTNEYIAARGNKYPLKSTEVYSKWISKVTLTENFENYPAYTSGSLMMNPETVVTAGTGTDGSKGMVYDADKDFSLSGDGSKRAWKNSYFRIIDLTKATSYKYKLSFKYKVVRADCDFNINLTSSTSTGNYWANVRSEKQIPVPASAADGEWHTFEGFEYTVEPWFNDAGTAFTPKALFLNTDNPNGGSFEIIYDDVVFEPLTSPVQTLCVIYPMNDEESDGDVINDLGYLDEPVKFPQNMTFGDRTFYGWATDREGTNIVTTDINGGGIKHGGKNMSYYGIWDRSGDIDPAMTTTFETYTLGSSLVFNQKLFTVTKEKAYGGKKSLRLKYNSEAAAAGVSKSALDNVFHLMKLEDGVTYKISFKYYAEQSGTDVSLTFLSNVQNVWDGAATEYPGGFTIPAGTEPGWKDGEMYLTAGVKISQSGNIGNTLFAIANMTGTEDTVIYFDSFKAEPVEGIVILAFDDGKGGGSLCAGKPGEAITFPKVNNPKGRIFSHWTKDKAGKIRFTDKVLTESMTVYAAYTPAEKVTFTYEDYSYKAQFAGHDFSVIETDKAYSGNHVVCIDRDPEHLPAGQTLNGSGAGFPVADSNVFNMVAGYNYIITFKYYIAKQGTRPGQLLGEIADTHNIWNKYDLANSKFEVSATEPEGVWLEGSYAFDLDFTENENDVDRRGLYFRFTDFDKGLIYFDDITIIRVPDGEAGICIKQNGWDKVPLYVTAKIGSNFQNKIPAGYSRPGYTFKGYMLGSKVLEDWTVPANGINIKTKWAETRVTQNFDETYLTALGAVDDYCVTDFDYELYDSQAPGNSADNVTSGRYSLHRKGNTMYFENACILNSGRLSGEDRYTATFKVKMDSCKQTDGAVKFVCGVSSQYPWYTTGEYIPVIAIADLTDGEWHEVTFTFYALEAYLSVQTPGYCSIYFDDFDIVLADKDAPITAPCEFTEYVVAKRDENGNLMKSYKSDPVDIDSIVDSSLSNGILSGGKNLLWWIIGGAAAAAAGLAVFFIIRKKKKSE